MTLKTADIKRQDKDFNNRRALERQQRKRAHRTLSPSEIRRAIQNGELPAYSAVLIGSKPGGDPFTMEDMRSFDKGRKATAKKWGRHSGAPIDQLIVASRNIDVQRANQEIRAANLYKIRGDVLHFNVTASGKHKETSYQVRIRLENWMEELTGTQRSWSRSINRVLQGNVSIDCQCGRYRYWYRYVATAGNFSIAPHEKDFPKIRNPKLTGCCCKHQLKALAALKSPTVKAQLAKQMEKQADKVGFAGDNVSRFLTKDEREEISRARPRDIDKETSIAAINKIKKAKRIFSKQVKDKKYIKNLEKQVQSLRKQLLKSSREIEMKTKARKSMDKRREATKKANHDQLKTMLRSEIDRAAMYGSSREQAIKVFAQLNNISVNEANKLAGEL